MWPRPKFVEHPLLERCSAWNGSFCICFYLNFFLVLNRFELISVGDLKSHNSEHFKWSSSLVIQLIWRIVDEESPVGTSLNDRKNESLKLTIKCIIISIFNQTLAIIVNRCVIGIVWISSFKDSARIPSEDIHVFIIYNISHILWAYIIPYIRYSYIVFLGIWSCHLM